MILTSWSTQSFSHVDFGSWTERGHSYGDKNRILNSERDGMCPPSQVENNALGLSLFLQGQSVHNVTWLTTQGSLWHHWIKEWQQSANTLLAMGRNNYRASKSMHGFDCWQMNTAKFQWQFKLLKSFSLVDGNIVNLCSHIESFPLEMTQAVVKANGERAFKQSKTQSLSRKE